MKFRKTILANLRVLMWVSLYMVTLNAIVTAAPIRFFPITLKQPDNKVINAFLSGDEHYNWVHDAKNYTIVQNKTTGFYVYASLQSGTLVASDYVVGITDPTTTKLEPDLHPPISQIEQIRNEKIRSMFSYEAKKSPTGGTLNNIVIFIRFSGEAEYTDANSLYDNMYNNAATGANSMHNYYLEASYNQLNIQTYFYPVAGGSTVVSYQDPNPRGYYLTYNAVTNPNGYQTSTDRMNREHTLLRNAVNAVSGQIPANLNVDSDNDGYVDNVCFVVSGSPGAWADLLWPHMWSLYSQTVTINGKRVYNYNLQLQNFLTGSGAGVLCHEMFHTLGAPDLYHYSYDGFSPVGPWDLMEQNANPPQHMSAYMKFRYGHWINSIPVIGSGNYTLNALTSSTNNCYRINSSNSSSEYFVLEYRKQSGTFESSVPGSGLVVYRVNTARDGAGNSNGPPDELYVFRPGGSNSSNGNTNLAFLSSESGRTSISPTGNPALLLSNGTSGNVAITGIGTSAGSSIGFTVNTSPVATITLNPSSAINFGNVAVNTGLSRSYTVSGSNLTSNVIITAPTGFQVSTTLSSGYTSSISLAPSAGALNNVAIYTRFLPAFAGYQSGVITHTSNGATMQTIAVDGTGVLPTIIASVTSLTSFGNVLVGSSSTAQSFTVGGSTLSGDITIAAPTGYQVSSSASSGYGSVLTLTQSSGTVNTTTVYVKFVPGLSQVYTGSIQITSPGASAKFISVTGRGYAPTIAVSSTATIAFGNVAVNQSSAAKSFTVSGSYLSGDISISSPTNFKISLSVGSGYSNGITLTQSGGNVAICTVYVQYTPTSTGSQSGNIVLSSSGAGTVSIPVSGAGVVPSMTVSADSLPSFGGVALYNASAVKSYTVSGTGLAGNIVVTGTADYQISLSSTSGWTNTINLVPSNGTVATTAIYVRLVPVSGGLKSASISNATSGLATKLVLVNGSGQSPQITLTPSTAINFGNVAVNTGLSRSYTVSGQYLSGPLVITAPGGFQVSLALTSGYATSLTLNPNVGVVGSTTIYTRFMPPAATSYSGNITHASTNATTQNIAVSGAGVMPQITVSPSSLSSFGNILVGNTSSSQSYTVSGSSLSSDITVSAPTGYQVSLSSSSGYAGQLTLTQSSGSVSNTTVYVRFSPASVGTNAAAITNTSSGATTQSVSVTGLGYAPTISTNSLGITGFGNVAVNQSSAAKSFTVSGSYLSGDISISSPTNFKISLSAGSGYSNGITLTQSGGNVAICTVYVQYTPTATGSQSGNIVLSSSGAGTVSIPVSGAGVVPSMTVSADSLPNFGGVALYNASAVKSYTVSGTGLAGNIVVTGTADYQISLSSTSGWTNTINLAPSNGTVATTAIYVRLVPVSGGLKSASISNATSGLATKLVLVNGSGNAPQITLNPSTAINFGTVTVNTGLSRSYTVAGAYLSGSIVITAPSGFQVSLALASGYTTSVTLNPNVGIVPVTTIYTRFLPSIAGSQSGNITHVSSGATTQNIAVSGIGASPSIAG
ncbi:MAG: M6 family metalloprotease domain-containing protein, partial [Ignavibacteria bacterium]|nr:M6 family metalloprotease domain-containing protein [Ignavibacteria bacterium]